MLDLCRSLKNMLTDGEKCSLVPTVNYKMKISWHEPR